MGGFDGGVPLLLLLPLLPLLLLALRPNELATNVTSFSSTSMHGATAAVPDGVGAKLATSDRALDRLSEESTVHMGVLQRGKAQRGG